MPRSLTGKQSVALGVVLLVAAVTGAWLVASRGSLGVALLLLLQVLLLLAVVVLRNQVSAVQRATSAATVRRTVEAAGAQRLQRLEDGLATERHRAEERHRELLAAAAGLDDALRQDLARVEQRAEARAGESARAEEMATEFRQEVRQNFLQVPVDTWSLLNLVRLVAVDREFPPAGGWAATPQTLLTLVSEVQSLAGDCLVVECGSGTSTVWLAATMRQRGAGRVVALEHEDEFADATRQALARSGLQDWADVRSAPLVDLPLGEETWSWYDTTATADLHDIDVLLVDGPPWRTGELARYPAAPVLVPALSPTGMVVLDDVGRVQEKTVANRWVSEVYAGRRLRRDRRLDRSQTFRLEA